MQSLCNRFTLYDIKLLEKVFDGIGLPCTVGVQILFSSGDVNVAAVDLTLSMKIGLGAWS